ncbi:MAG TPA: hypothetical protein VID48_01590 [Solirubrobacteraceae bacterium]|jgi:4-hydroxy-3-methylbut-2-enyl diphosphate reductase
MRPIETDHTRGLLILSPLRLEALAINAGAPRLRVQRVGMGPQRASAAVAKLARDPARALVVLGVCGGLVDGDRPGEVIVAERVSAVEDNGELGPMTPCSEPRALAGALLDRGLRARCGTIACTSRIVHGEARGRLNRSGADAVEMESAWLAEAANGRGFAVIRVVADTPNHDLSNPLAALGSWVSALLALRRTASALQQLATDGGLGALLGED